MSRKIVCVFITMIMIFSITGCFKEKDSDALKFKEEYESLNGEKSKSGKVYPEISIDEDNIVKYSSIDSVLEILDGGTGVIYFGFPECPWCRNALPVLLSASESTNIDCIYYVNMLELRDVMEISDNGEVITTTKAEDNYYELIKKLDSILLDYTLTDDDGNEVSTGEKRIYVPLVVFVKDGEIVDSHSDTVVSQDDPYVLLNEEQKSELFDIYTTGIHKVLGDVCDEEEHC